VALILVVDDNPTNLKLVAAVLGLSGHTVAQSTDADTARELIAHRRPDLVLLDIGMPGMDGLALTRLLKADEQLRQIPIVALTAFAMRSDEARVRDAGCDGYITKPIDTRAFPEQVARALRLGPAKGARA
jgi:CheY-like chemotaxis protein